MPCGQTLTFYFPEELKSADYNVTLTDADADKYTTAVQKDEDEPADESAISGRLGENLSDEPPSGLSVVTFTHKRVTGDLKIGKTVVCADAGDADARFPFVVTLKDAGINKTYNMVRNTGAEEVTEEITFQAGVATVELSDGERVTIADLPTDLSYTVAEDLSGFLVSNRIRTMVSKNEAEAVTAKSASGILGEKKEENRAVSTLAFTNNYLEIVCKITNKNRALLYYAESGGKLVPAIFDNLADAFARVNAGGLKTASGGTASGTLRVEMVVADYTLNDEVVLNKGKSVVLSTALTTDNDGYPYTGEEDTTAKITRGTLTGCMIEDGGSLTLDKIVLDGDSALDMPVNVEANGGIVQVNGAVTLTVSSGARLQNSATTGNGGAIWMGSGASLNLTGDIQNCAGANGGGVYADNGFKKIELYGAITDCKASGDGAGLFAGTGSSGVILYAGSTLARNSANGNGGGLCSLANVVLRGAIGGDEQPNSAKKGGGLYMGTGAMLTMYSTGSIIGNNATGNGGGLYALGTARIAGGTITDNSGANGGGVYGGESSTVTISNTATKMNNNGASESGGAVYAGGSLSMSGGSMTSNSAKVSGGAVYLAAGQTFTMTGGSITGGNRSPEGAVSTGKDSVLVFSGKATVTGNTANDGVTAMNVYLGYDSNAVITTPGLGSAANIGVYAADGEDNSIYYGHGIAARNFGTYTGTNTATANLNKFVNDRDEKLTGLAGAASDGGANIMWHGRNLILTVYKYGTTEALANVSFTLTNAEDVQVWSGKSNASGLVTIPWGVSEAKGGNAASFEADSQYVLQETASNNDTVRPAGSWTLTIGSNNSVTWTTTANEGEQNRTLDIESEETIYIGETGFALYNDVQPKLTLNANGGTLYGKTVETSTETIQFTTTETSHEYTLEEENPIQSSSVFVRWATEPLRPEDYDETRMVSETVPDYREYQKGDTITWYRDSEDDDLTLYAQWDSVVCKITDNAGRLLYVDGNPAVYATLEAGFEDFNKALFTTSSGARATPREIKMLKKAYTLMEPVELARRNARKSYNYAVLTTASASDKDGYPGPFDGSDATVCVITRGKDCNESMITNNASLMLTSITLDGDGHRNGREDDHVVVCDGGIVNNVQTSAVLTIADGATLRNSFVEGNGGAVNAIAGTTVYLTGGTISNNSVSGTSGSGAGIYLAKGSRLYLSGNPSFENNVSDAELPAGTTNGGTEYTQARQDIYLAGAAEVGEALTSITLNGNLDDSIKAGSIWVWAEGNDNTEPNHYYMLKQFAVVSFTGTISEATCKAFRNARPDADTDCGGDYLTGQTGDSIGTNRCLYWTGGYDFSFLKVDGFGKPLPGATFTLYTSYTNKDVYTLYQKGGENVMATSSDGENEEKYPDPEDSSKAQPEGTVLFSKIAPKVYYMVETKAPEGYVANSDEFTTIYRLTMLSDGSATLERKLLSEDDAAYQEVYKVETQAATEATATEPAKDAVYQYRVMNTSTAQRKAILRKVEENTNKPLPGVKFEVLRYDRTQVSSTDINGGTETTFTSGDSGVYFIDMLPFGTYYLHETKNASGAKVDLWFILTVNENGVGYETEDLKVINTLRPETTTPD